MAQTTYADPEDYERAVIQEMESAWQSDHVAKLGEEYQAWAAEQRAASADDSLSGYNTYWLAMNDWAGFDTLPEQE